MHGNKGGKVIHRYLKVEVLVEKLAWAVIFQKILSRNTRGYSNVEEHIRI